MAYYVMFGPYSFEAIAESKPDHFINAKGNNECVEFVRQATGAPSTKNWRPGKNVKGANDIPSGAAIATFKSERYSVHAAIYLGQDDLGLWVLDQWNKQGHVAKRRIRFPTGKESQPVLDQNNGNLFYVIDTVDTEDAASKEGEVSRARIV
ncbi:BPSL0067 family protein [Mesorhizobium sp. CN2-181]|uniref:BPSL0067 family protein n=1 Tax=Mesorhizobium yinganensis TaxID=3157707 RepID=UPI0032B85B63